MTAMLITTRGIEMTIASHQGTDSVRLSGGFSMFKWLKQNALLGDWVNILFWRRVLTESHVHVVPLQVALAERFDARFTSSRVTFK